MEDILKLCCLCRVEQPLLNFNKSQTGILGHHNHCRTCQKIIKRRWYLKNRESELAKGKTKESKEMAKNLAKKKYYSDEEWRKTHLEKSRIRRRTCPTAKKKASEQRKRWLSKPHNRIAQRLRNRLREALKGIGKFTNTEKLLGCSFEFFKEYLENKFLSGMTWENYGSGWQVDHIIPCSVFNLESEGHQKKCFHYSNLQPLWAKDNMSKGNKVPVNFSI